MAVLMLAAPGPIATPAGARDDPAPAETTSTTTSVFVVDPEDYPGLNVIIGSPEAGPKPTDAGDRGGWLQFALLGTLVVAVAVVLVRILRAATRHQ